MAEATKNEAAQAEAVPAAPKSGLLSSVLNIAGIFAASLVAVVAGGFINAQLHHPPEYVLEKDGRMKVYVPPPPNAKKEKKAKAKEEPVKQRSSIRWIRRW